MSIDNEIRKGEAEAQLHAQLNAHKTAEVEILKHQKKIADYKETLISLDKEMEKTKERIKQYDGK